MVMMEVSLLLLIMCIVLIQFMQNVILRERFQLLIYLHSILTRMLNDILRPCFCWRPYSHKRLTIYRNYIVCLFV